MEITQEEKSSGENLPTSSLEEDVGEVLESTPNLLDDSQVGKNADNEVNPQIQESAKKERSFKLNHPRAGKSTAENCNK